MPGNSDSVTRRSLLPLSHERQITNNLHAVTLFDKLRHYRQEQIKHCQHKALLVKADVSRVLKGTGRETATFRCVKCLHRWTIPLSNKSVRKTKTHSQPPLYKSRPHKTCPGSGTWHEDITERDIKDDGWTWATKRCSGCKSSEYWPIVIPLEDLIERQLKSSQILKY